MTRGFKLWSHSFVSTFFISHVCTYVENSETKHLVFSYMCVRIDFNIYIFKIFNAYVNTCKYIYLV